MFKPFITAVALWSAVLTSSWAEAHPGHSQQQVATSSRPNSEATSPTRETFVAVRDGQLQWRRSDDSLVTHKLSDLNEADRLWAERRMAEIDRMNRTITPNDASRLLAQNRTQRTTPTGKSPETAKAFEAFVKAKAIQTRWDENFLYVESNGMPHHPMMIGITSWQQQVPLPQPYVGDNAWRIPLHPVPAQKPLSTKGAFLRGAIALAANGIPIFNPLNNRGDDAFLFGELDEYGGHCGRADDYHYHIAPVHLENAVGQGLPIAYALDGYPIYGYAEPDGSLVKGLDKFNGHTGKDGHYHYHATKTYPYLNGGFHGEVTERDGQVDPQPRAEPLREAGSPMRDTKIVGFEESQPGSYKLTYELKGKPGSVSYDLNQDGSAKFTYVATNGTTDSETYTPRRRGPEGERRPPRNESQSLVPRDGDRPPLPATPLIRPAVQPVAIPQDATRVPVVFTGGYETDPRDGGRPVVLIAAALGVTPEVFRSAFSKVQPARGGGGPTSAQARQNKSVLMAALGKHGITNERLDEVSNQYRYPPGRQGLWSTKPAEAVALVKDGVVYGFEVTRGGAGYSSPPQVTVPGIPGATGQVELKFDKRFEDNGAVLVITLAHESQLPGLQLPGLTVTSTAIDAQGFLGVDYTCDGTSASPQVAWTGAPTGTKCFAVNVWHTPGPGDLKSYWVVYNIPASVTSLDKNSQGIGTAGLNDKRRAAYDPMCSKGPGVKTYHITVFALSAEVQLNPDEANRANLLAAIQDITLAEGTLDFKYERQSKALLPLIIGGTTALLLIAGFFYGSQRYRTSQSIAHRGPATHGLPPRLNRLALTQFKG